MQEAQGGHGCGAFEFEALEEFLFVDVAEPFAEGCCDFAGLAEGELAAHHGDGAAGFEGVELGGEDGEGGLFDQLADGGVALEFVGEATGEEHAGGGGEGGCEGGREGCDHDVGAVAGDDDEVAVGELGEEVGDGHGRDFDVVDVAVKEILAHAFVVEAEVIDDFGDSG